MKYDFEFSWASTYGFAATLVARTCERGLVVDLGCGAGSFAAPLDELGFDYLGFEYDPESVALCRSRGIACEPIDLADVDDTIERVTAAVGGRPVRVVSLLDVIEHLVDPERVVAGLRRLVEALTVDGRAPRVVVSIPNVAHADLAVKLVAGRWDVVDVGLLDDTHVTLFTERRVRDTFARHGFAELAANDVVIPDTEQQYPADHPAVAREATLSAHLRAVRRRADTSGDTYQFVRCYEVGPVTGESPPTLADRADTEGPRLSVVVHVRDGAGVGDLLTCLAAQHDRDLEVLLVSTSSTVDAGAAVAGYDDAFGSLVRVVPPARCLADACNAALDLVGGRLVAFLDESTVVTGRWSAGVHEAAAAFPGRALRCATVVQPAHVADGRIVPTEGFGPDRTAAGDEIGRLLGGEPPGLDGLVVPAAALDGLGHRFDPSLGDVAATWLFVLRLVADTGLVRTAEVDAVRRGAEPSVDDERDRAAWSAVAAVLDQWPYLLPSGAASQLGALHELRRERDTAVERADAAEARVDALERSRYWTATAPLRRLGAARHRLGRGGGR